MQTNQDNKPGNQKESNVLNRILDYKNYTFKVNWASGAALVVALTWAITVTIKNDGYRIKIDKQGDTIDEQGDTIDELEKTVIYLQGTMNGFEQLSKAFIDNPPQALEEKINGLNLKIENYHNNEVPPPGAFQGQDTSMTMGP